MNPKKREHSTITREPELAVLNILISATHTWTDTQAVLSVALEQVAKLSESDGSECHLVNSAGELQFTAQYNLDPDFMAGSLEIRFPLGIGIPGRSYASQSAIFIPDIASEEHYRRRRLAKQAGYRSLICIPLSGMDTLLGTFTLYYREKIQPVTDLREILTTIGKQMGIAVERARLFQKNAEQVKELQVLQTVANALNRSANIQEALERSLEAVIAAMQLQSGWVVLLDRNQEIQLAAAHNLPPELNPADWAAMKVPCQCLALLQQGRLESAINIIECQQLRRLTNPHYPLRHHASIPIRAGTMILGNLNLVTPSDCVFTESELRMFTAIGDQIGVAMERARLYEQVKARHIEEQSVLLRLSQALLSETEAQAMMDTAVQITAGSLKVEFAAIALIDTQEQTFSGQAAIGWPPELLQKAQHVPLSADTGLAYALRTRAPVIIPDEACETRFDKPAWVTEAGITSSLLAPIIVGGEVIGGLVINSRTPRDWPDNEVRLLSLIANNTGQALERAWQHAHAVERLERISALHDIDVAITSYLNLEDTLKVLLEKVTERLRVDAAAVALIKPDTQELVYAARRGLDGDFFQDGLLRVKEGIVGQVAHSDEPVAIPDVSIEPRFVRRAVAERLGLVSYLAVPLRARGEVIGVLELATRRQRAFLPEEVDFFVTLAGQAAIVIDNVRMFESERAAREQAELLREAAGMVSSTLDLDEVLRQILIQLKRMLPYDTASVLLLGEGDKPALVVGTGYTDEQKTSQSAGDLLMDSRILRQMALDQQPILIADVRQDPDWIWISGAEHVRTFLAVPIVTRGQLIGALMIDSMQIGFFNESQVRLTQTLAQHMAVAIKNARLFDAFVNEQQHTALLYHLSLELATNLKPENVANRALQAAADTLGVTRGNILTLEDDDEHLQMLAVTGYDRETIEALNQRLNWTISQGVTGRVVRTRMATTIPDVSQDADWIPISGLDDWVQSILSVPLVAGNRVIGTLNLLSEQLGFFKTENLSLITAIASPVALALQNARLYEGLRQRFKELEILADTSSALRKAQAYNDILPILLAKAVEGLKSDAGVLLLLENNALKFAATYGETNVKTGDTCPQDAGMMWQALESGKPLFIPDVTQIEELHKSAVCHALMGDALSCACVPLQTTASAIGVVYLNWKKKTFLSADESRLLESIAEIAANAIQRSALHKQTTQQALDLTLAYDATIEGWTRVLDLRDRETEGHTQRVTSMALQLARAMGIEGSEIEHFRRGALLHDIGKMAIPDIILHKPAALSAEELILMRHHPQIAYDMLSHIAYLQPALDIPHYHHEKWDGSGYPRGLKEEEIPLAARIFAVADVFDALTSDRPYRPTWTKKKAVAYIRRQAGIHFDPNVVETFLKMVGKM